MSTTSSPHPLTWKPPPRGEDLPYDDGEPMESEKHVLQMGLLINSLRRAWKDRHDFYVGGNMFIYFSEPQAKKNDFRGPDVFVVLDTTQRVRKSWVVWEEEGRTPDVVIELISPSTEKTDRGDKMRIYSRVLKVAEYYLYDPLTHDLEGYQLDLESQKYVPIAPDAKGRLRCHQLGLMLGVCEGTYANVADRWLRWMTPDGEILVNGDERAEQETQRAEQEAQRAEQEAQRAEQEARRAEQEARRASGLEKELAELKQRLANLERE
jgi:Uma2 family endonuclease